MSRTYSLGLWALKHMRKFTMKSPWIAAAYPFVSYYRAHNWFSIRHTNTHVRILHPAQTEKWYFCILKITARILNATAPPLTHTHTKKTRIQTNAVDAQWAMHISENSMCRSHKPNIYGHVLKSIRNKMRREERRKNCARAPLHNAFTSRYTQYFTLECMQEFTMIITIRSTYLRSVHFCSNLTAINTIPTTAS